MYDTIENGKRLRELRGKRTREEVSKETGIGITSLAMYESGERNPRDEVKLTLANYYGKTVSDIFFA